VPLRPLSETPELDALSLEDRFRTQARFIYYREHMGQTPLTRELFDRGVEYLVKIGAPSSNFSFETFFHQAVFHAWEFQHTDDLSIIEHQARRIHVLKSASAVLFFLLGFAATWIATRV
jgi:hypothetical protein